MPPNRPNRVPRQPAGQFSCKACASGIDGVVPCEYAAGVACYCLGNPVGVPASESQWECYGPPRTAIARKPLPNLGDGGEINGQACHYVIVQLGCHAPYAACVASKPRFDLSP